MGYLSELLRIEQIQLKLAGKDKLEVLREMVGMIPEIRAEAAHQESLLQALLERERLHTTATGDGIALPHARNPLHGVLKRPILVFGRHVAGVPFAAPDNQPVKLLFLLASPTLTDHLAMLARLSRVLRDQKLRGELLSRNRPEEVLRCLAEAEERGAK